MYFNTMTSDGNDGTIIHQCIPYVISTDVNTTFKLLGCWQPSTTVTGSRLVIALKRLRAFYANHKNTSALKMLWRAECIFPPVHWQTTWDLTAARAQNIHRYHKLMCLAPVCGLVYFLIKWLGQDPLIQTKGRKEAVCTCTCIMCMYYNLIQ